MTNLFPFWSRRKKPQRAFASKTFVICSKNEHGTYRVRIDDMSRGRHAIKCFLSPVDALIEASILAKSGDSYEVAAVAAIDRDAILTGPGRRLVACVHRVTVP